MARGQITVEFILILIIVLTIITTVSIPLIQFATDTLQDTGNGVLLAQVVGEIKSAADSVSMSGCGSYEIVHINTGELNSSIGSGLYSINITGTGAGDVAVKFRYYLQNGTEVSGKTVLLPNYISVSCKNKDGIYDVNISKDCTHLGGTASCNIP